MKLVCVCYELQIVPFSRSRPNQSFCTFWRHESTKIDRLLHKMIPTLSQFSSNLPLHRTIIPMDKQTKNTKEKKTTGK